MSSVTSTTQIPLRHGMTALRADHIPQAVSLSAALGWPYRAEDWRFAFELGHGVAVETDGGLAATALWWPYEKAFASFGMIIVTPALQGRGIGRLLMDELLRQADGRAIVLNSTREGYRLYERLGFVPCGQVNQHQAVFAGCPARVASERRYSSASARGHRCDSRSRLPCQRYGAHPATRRAFCGRQGRCDRARGAACRAMLAFAASVVAWSSDPLPHVTRWTRKRSSRRSQQSIAAVSYGLDVPATSGLVPMARGRSGCGTSTTSFRWCGESPRRVLPTQRCLPYRINLSADAPAERRDAPGIARMKLVSYWLDTAPPFIGASQEPVAGTADVRRRRRAHGYVRGAGAGQ